MTFAISTRPSALCTRTRRAPAPARAAADGAPGALPRRAVATALAAALLAPRPAAAFLGFGGGSKDEAYNTETTAVITTVRAALALGRDDPAREAAVAGVRAATNSWVAKYRRDTSFSGKPSYGNVYSALNAVAGHINSFGADTPLPAKRLDRVTKELADAELMLSRGR